MFVDIPEVDENPGEENVIAAVVPTPIAFT